MPVPTKFIEERRGGQLRMKHKPTEVHRALNWTEEKGGNRVKRKKRKNNKKWGWDQYRERQQQRG